MGDFICDNKFLWLNQNFLNTTIKFWHGQGRQKPLESGSESG